jgi:uncharacterized protein YoxC
MSEEKNINSHSLKCKENVWKKFVSLIDEMDNVNTQGQALERLIDVYEEPPKTKILDKEIASQNEDLIKKNQELSDEIDELMECNKNLVAQVENLEAKIEELTSSGNANAMAAQRIQMELDKANETIAARANRPENFIEMYVHPIFFYFLKKMTEIFNKKYKKNLSYGDFLVDLFRRDMLHSRGNNLPDVISESEFIKVVDKYAEQHPDEFTKDEIKLLKSV